VSSQTAKQQSWQNIRSVHLQAAAAAGPDQPLPQQQRATSSTAQRIRIVFLACIPIMETTASRIKKAVHNAVADKDAGLQHHRFTITDPKLTPCYVHSPDAL
jgi:hypothetical protein